jgi:hypothetical protein
MYSQPWSPTASTTVSTPELRTAKRSPAMPRTNTSPLVAPYNATLPTIMLFSEAKVAFGLGNTASLPPERPLPK